MKFFSLRLFLALAVPLIVLGSMFLWNQWQRAHSQIYTVRLEQIDPIDPFRGEYMVLQFADWDSYSFVQTQEPENALFETDYRYLEAMVDADGFLVPKPKQLEHTSMNDVLLPFVRVELIGPIERPQLQTSVRTVTELLSTRAETFFVPQGSNERIPQNVAGTAEVRILKNGQMQVESVTFGDVTIP
jgi:uncharacterized membrane-anchored protein